MRFYSPKIIKCERADIHIHYANNRGRGTNNTTVTVVIKDTPRPQYTRLYNSSDIISQHKKSSWRGIVHLSKDFLERYGFIN